MAPPRPIAALLHGQGDVREGAARVLVKLLQTGKVSARSHLGDGVLRSVLLACRLRGQPSPSSSDDDDDDDEDERNEEAKVAADVPSSLDVTNALLTHCSDDLTESHLVDMMDHLLCHATAEDVAAFYGSRRGLNQLKQRAKSGVSPSKISGLIFRRSKALAELDLLEGEENRRMAETEGTPKENPSTKKKDQASKEDTRGSNSARVEELTGLVDELSNRIVATGTFLIADQIVAYSKTNGPLLRSALRDGLTCPGRGEATTLLSILARMLRSSAGSGETISASTAAGSGTARPSRTVCAVQWISALADAHLPVLLSEEARPTVAAVKEAVAAASAQAEAIAGMRDLLETIFAKTTDTNADNPSSSPSASAAAPSSRSVAGKVITYDSMGRRRLTAVRTEDEEARNGRIPSYSIERLSII